MIWLDVRETTSPRRSLTWNYETAPSKDNNLFAVMANNPSVPLTPGIQTLQKVIFANNPSVPLATWMRWRLSPSGSTTPWDATFRILFAANRVVRDCGARMFARCEPPGQRSSLVGGATSK